MHQISVLSVSFNNKIIPHFFTGRLLRTLYPSCFDRHNFEVIGKKTYVSNSVLSTVNQKILLLENCNLFSINLIIFEISFWRKPILFNRFKKLHEKGHKLIAALLFFCLRSWTFENYRTQSLWKDLSEIDKEIFGFNMKAYSWKDILWTHVDGIRIHLMKEELTPENKERGLRRLKMWVIFIYFVDVPVLMS